MSDLVSALPSSVVYAPPLRAPAWVEPNLSDIHGRMQADGYQDLRAIIMAQRPRAVTFPAGWSAFEKVATGLLGIVTVLIGLLYAIVTSDIFELKKTGQDTTKAIQATREDMIRSVAAVEKQGAIANQKMDDFISEMRRQRR